MLADLEIRDALSDYLGEKNHYFGVVKFPLRLIQMDGIKLEADDSAEADDYAADLPPLLIEYERGKFYCIEQKGLFSRLKRRKVNAYSTIIVLKESADYKRFMKHYGHALFFINHA